MAYPLHAIYDVSGRHVGFLDGPFVLDHRRRVVAEVRAGTVIRIDGRVSDTYEAACFLDAVSRVVAVTSGVLPVPAFWQRFFDNRPAVPAKPPGPAVRRPLSRLTWREYIER